MQQPAWILGFLAIGSATSNATSATTQHFASATESRLQGATEITERVFGLENAPMRRVRARGLQERRTGYQGLPGPSSAYQDLPSGFRRRQGSSLHLTVIKAVIPSFQGCRRCQEKSKITDRCG